MTFFAFRTEKPSPSPIWEEGTWTRNANDSAMTVSMIRPACWHSANGVFAIVITLLVLEIHVPELAGGQNLRDALQEVRPSFVGFLISFLVTAIAWSGHRDLFAMIRRTDRNLVWLNILYLLPLSLLPFGAALISRYDQESVALRMYGVLLLLIASTRLSVWLYATKRPHLLFEPITRRTRTVGVLIVASACRPLPASRS